MRENKNYMDCAEFSEMYHELDRPGTIGSAFRDRALLHAETCSRCATLLTEAEALDFALRKLAEQSADSHASSRIEAELLHEFKRAKVATSSHKVRWHLAVLGVAAAVLLVAGVLLHYRIVPGLDGKSKTADVAVNPASSAGATNATLSAMESAEDEYAADFVPLPYADDPSALEGGAIVRVTLPRSALVSFGVPVTEGDTGDTVLADLAVSIDGTPQAIRLVPDSDSDF